jgi:hypothetical protein
MNNTRLTCGLRRTPPTSPPAARFSCEARCATRQHRRGRTRARRTKNRRPCLAAPPVAACVACAPQVSALGGCGVWWWRTHVTHGSRVCTKAAAMDKLRILTFGRFRVGPLTRPFRDARSISLDTTVARTRICTYACGRLDLSVVQATCQTLTVTIRNFHIAVCPCTRAPCVLRVCSMCRDAR